MKLIVSYPDESFLKPAEEAWQRFVDTVQPPPVEVTDIYWGEAPQDAIAEAEAVQDLPRDPHLILRLSAQFFRFKALFMTVWRPSTRSAEHSCGIRQG